jgi:multiple sugar transport system substrate-binding protein
MKKILTIAMVFALVAPLTFANGASEAKKTDAGVTTIQFANWMSAEDSTRPAYDALVADFEKKNPSIKVENLSLPYNQVFDQLLILNAGGNPPDCAQLHGSWVSALQNAGALENLYPYVSEELLEDFYPSVLQSCKYGDELSILPWAPSPVALYYNKTLLKKAGYDNPPKTIKEMYQMARDISALKSDANGNKIYGVGIQSKKMVSSGFYFLPYIWNYGGNLVDDDGNVVINSDATRTAFAMIGEIFDEDVTPAGLEIKDMRNLFAQGNLGFHTDGDFGYPVFLKLSPKGADFADEIGIAQVPSDFGNKTSFFIEHDLGVFKKSTKKDAAAKFITYLSSAEALEIYNANNGNKTPSRYSAEKIDFYNQPGNEHNKEFIDLAKNGQPLPQRNPGFVAAMEEIAEGIQRVGINNENANVVVLEMSEKIEDLYTEN